MLARAVDGLLESGAVDRVVVIVPAGLGRLDATDLPGEVDVVAGGAERTDSVRAGLARRRTTQNTCSCTTPPERSPRRR